MFSACRAYCSVRSEAQIRLLESEASVMCWTGRSSLGDPSYTRDLSSWDLESQTWDAFSSRRTACSSAQWNALEPIRSNYEDYFEKDEKIKGYLILAVATNIQHIVESQDTSREAFAELRRLYGTPGVAVAFTDFLTTIRWSFTGKEGPAPQISKFLSHIQRLATHNIVLPKDRKSVV